MSVNAGPPSTAPASFATALPLRYSCLAITLHWAIALALAAQAGLGFRLSRLAGGPDQFWAFQLHKSIGLTILVLSIARLAIRFAVRRPAPLADNPSFAWLAGLVHAALYGVMVGGPLTGWLIVSSASIRVPTLVFGLLPWPHLPVPAGWHDAAAMMHLWLAWLGIALFVLHVAGALRHQLLLGDRLVERMLPGGRPLSRAGGATAIVVPVIAILATGVIAGTAGRPGQPHSAKATAATPIASTSGVPEASATPAIATSPAPAPAPSAAKPTPKWRVEQGGRLGFHAQLNGEAIDGRFAHWRGDIRFSPETPKDARIRIAVDMTSASTQDSQRDEMLAGAEFFETGAHSEAVFVSTAVEPVGGDRYRTRGTLTLKGVSRPVTLAFTLAIKGDRATVIGNTRIDRTTFAVGTGSWAATDALAANVTIDFAFTAAR